MWRSRMFWRLFGVYGALLLSSISLLGLIVLQRIENYAVEQIKAGLRHQAVLIREAVREVPPGQGSRLQERLQALREELEVRVTLVAADGRVLADSESEPAAMDNHGERPE